MGRDLVDGRRDLARIPWAIYLAPGDADRTHNKWPV